jgi:hypothetical protein
MQTSKKQLLFAALIIAFQQPEDQRTVPSWPPPATSIATSYDRSMHQLGKLSNQSTYKHAKLPTNWETNEPANQRELQAVTSATATTKTTIPISFSAARQHAHASRRSFQQLDLAKSERVPRMSVVLAGCCC